jgi:probable F420-dependent oxidoreductase
LADHRAEHADVTGWVRIRWLTYGAAMFADLGVTFAGFSPLGPRRATEVAARSEALGYRSFWTAEASGPESFATLAACGEAAPGLDLGTGIIPVQVRSPLLAAMGAATLQALHPERRILLGVGISTPTITQRWHGVPYAEAGPLRVMREYLTLLRRLFAGETVTAEGPTWTLKGATLGVRLGGHTPELVLAALNRGMLQLAGEAADGVLLNYLPAAHVAASVAAVRAGEAAAGRPAGSCRVYAYVHVGVADRDEARDRARRDVFNYAAAKGYGDMMAKAGFEAEITAMREAQARRDHDGALAALSDAMVDAIDLVGSAEEVRAFVASYVAAGVEAPIVMPLPWGPDRMAVIDDTLVAVAG